MCQVYNVKQDVVVLEDLEEFIKEKLEKLRDVEEEFWDAWTEKGYYKQLTTVLGVKETVEFTNTCRVAWKKIVDAITILEHALKMIEKKETEEKPCYKYGSCDPEECKYKDICFEEILEE